MGKQHGHSQSAKLIKKHPIGSLHYGPNLNYQKNYRFFPAEDIPLEKRLIHQEIKDFIDPDILGFKRKVWTSNVSGSGKKKPEQCTVEEELAKVIYQK